jgi:hypothetical protein
MRVIAVFSALVLIPTLIGQTLGTNILGAPFTLYLWEVTAWIIYRCSWSGGSSTGWDD